MTSNAPPPPLREPPVALHKCCECVPALDRMNESLNAQRLSYQARYRAALSEIRWLVEVVRLYAGHTGDCMEMCSCGFETVLKDLDGIQAGEEP